jgi:hypothetical protein
MMNLARPLARPRAAIADPVRILVIGTRKDVQETIDQLCTLHFCDHAEWSKIQPKPDEPGQCLSIMTKWRI